MLAARRAVKALLSPSQLRTATPVIVEARRFDSLYRQMVDKVIPTIQETTHYDVFKRQEELTFVDVREEREWIADGVLDVNKHVELERGIVERDIGDFVPDLDAPLAVMCSGAMRSVLAVESLKRLGYTNVVSVCGGFDGWKALGFPVKEYTPPPPADSA